MQPIVVIPTYNEAENLAELVSALFALPVEGLRVLVVDDNSPDGTGEIADELVLQYEGRFSVIHRAGREGFGKAYLCGFRVALDEGAEAVLQMDADFSHSPGKVMELLAGLDGYDLVIGSRYIEGGELDRTWPLWRKGLSHFGNLYARTILGLPIRDVTGGFRAWRRETLTRLPLQRVRSNGYAFQIEMAYLAHLQGFTFREVPIYFAERRRGRSKMSLRIQIEAALRVWQMRFAYRDLNTRR